MATQEIEIELLDLERQYWQAVKDKDAEAVVRLTDDSCIIAGSRGVFRVRKEALPGMMESARYTLHDFQLSDDAQVRFLRDDVAIVAYRVHEELTVDGERIAVEASDASTWVRRHGQWVCALHTESITGDPYGRDRHPV